MGLHFLSLSQIHLQKKSILLSEGEISKSDWCLRAERLVSASEVPSAFSPVIRQSHGLKTPKKSKFPLKLNSP